MNVVVRSAKRSLIEWAMGVYYLNGARLSLAEHKYLLEPLKDLHPNQVMIKSAQLGLTEYNTILALYVAHELQKKSLTLFPTGNAIGDYVQARVDTVMEQSPELRQYTRRGGATGVARVRLKRLGRGMAYFRGAVSKNDVISVDADCCIVDELDECNVAHIDLVPERLKASTLGWLRKVSTPTYPDGPIDRAFQASDCRHFLMKCDSCNAQQRLDWYKNVVRETEGEDGGPRFTLLDPNVTREQTIALSGPYWAEAARDIGSINVMCVNCSKPINRLRMGEWVSEYPGRAVHGWHFTRLNSPRATIAALYHDFMEAQSSVSKLSIFHRMALGVAYDVMSEGLSRATLEMLAGKYSPSSVTGAEFTTCGVDVGTRLNVQISRFKDGRRVMVFHGAVREFTDLDRLLKTYRVDCCAIDSQPETREVKRFRDSQPHGKVYLTNFGLNCDGSKRNDSDWLKFNHLAAWIKCDRTMVFDDATDAITSIPPRAIFPRSFLDDNEWVEHMCAPRRMLVTRADGRERAIWDEGGKPDHYRLADVYDFLAMKAYLHREGVIIAPESATEGAAGGDDDDDFDDEEYGDDYDEFAEDDEGERRVGIKIRGG